MVSRELPDEWTSDVHVLKIWDFVSLVKEEGVGERELPSPNGTGPPTGARLQFFK